LGGRERILGPEAEFSTIPGDSEARIGWVCLTGKRPVGMVPPA
jgi:hypothetical protein